MTSDQFNQLSERDQMEAVLKGMFLADRLTTDHYVRLYNLENFYVEVFFDDETHLIDGFRAFEHTQFILPYLQNFKIAV